MGDGGGGIALVGLLSGAIFWSQTTRHSEQPATTLANNTKNTSTPFQSPQTADPGWPSIRGPRYDGTSPEINIADSWPAEGPPILWTKELSQGYSAFVAADDRVYSQYQTLSGQFVICIDAQTGETIWEFRYDWPFDPTGIYPGPRATPTLDGGRIYFAGTTGLIGCLSTEGKLLWSVNVKEEFDGLGTDFGYSCSPTVVDGKVILPVGGAEASMVALDAEDGKLVWKAGTHSASYTPALPVTVDGHKQVIGYLENWVICVELDTGKELWELKNSQGYDEHAAWPIYQEPFLWFAGPWRTGSKMLKLSGGANANYERVWESPLMSNDVASSVSVGGSIYGFDLHDLQTKPRRPTRGSFRCSSFATGNEQWANGSPKARRSTEPTSSEVPLDERIVGHATILVADGKLILFNDIGELILARVNPERYEELARVSVLSGELNWTAPALHHGRLYIRNHSRAVCVYLGDPKFMDRSSATQTIVASDIPQHTTNYLSDKLGIEPEYALVPPTFRWVWQWYGWSLAIIFVAAILSFAAELLPWPRMPLTQRRWMFWAFVFMLGIFCSIPLSMWRNDFIFTWPVSLFIVFQATVYQMKFRGKHHTTTSPTWLARLVAVAFILVCGGYYWLCSLVSLVPEWIFLCGFPAACVILVLERWLSRRPRQHLWEEWLLTTIAFSVFFWSAVGVIALNYNIPA